MKFSLMWVRVPAAFVLILIAVLGCSGGGNPSAPVLPRNEEGITLTLGSFSEAPVTGIEVTVPVLISDATGLYAFSFRLEFDPDGMVPVDVDWSGFQGENDVVFNPLDRPGILPMAYARLEGVGFDGDNTVCIVKFRILDPSRANLRIVDDPGYLVAYNPSHDRLNLVVGGES